MLRLGCRIALVDAMLCCSSCFQLLYMYWNRCSMNTQYITYIHISLNHIEIEGVQQASCAVPRRHAQPGEGLAECSPAGQDPQGESSQVRVSAWLLCQTITYTLRVQYIFLF